MIGPPEGRRGFWFLALLACATFVVFRWSAYLRVQSPLIADSIEYSTIARSLLSDDAFRLKPVRSPFFSLLLAIPLVPERLIAGAGPLDLTPALLVPLLSAVLAVLGTYRLGVLIFGPWAGLSGAFLLGVLPVLTYWSSDWLTDAAGAAAVVWAIVFWLEKKVFRVGVVLGVGVLLRYQGLIPMAAFFAVPVLTRRWRDLFRLSLGFLPMFALLGVLDAWYWGAPFRSLSTFVPRQLTTFLPVDMVGEVIPVDAVQTMPVPPDDSAVEAVTAKARTWYVERAPEVFGWPLLVCFLAFPLAAWKLRARETRAAVVLSLWIAGATLILLSFQRYKTERYLLGIAPMVAALGGASAAWFADAFARRAGSWSRPLSMLFLAILHTWTCWELQSVQRYRPFASFVDAVETIPAAARPCTVAVGRSWVLAPEHQFEVAERGALYSRDFTIYDIGLLIPYLSLPSEEQATSPFRTLVESVDYYAIYPPDSEATQPHLTWINENTVFDGLFFDPKENRRPLLRLRRDEREDRERPLWDRDDPLARNGDVRARFTTRDASVDTELVLVDVDVSPIAGGALALRLDLRWRLPTREGVTLRAEVRIGDEHGLLVADPFALIPRLPVVAEPYRGAALRISRYLTCLRPPIGKPFVRLRAMALFEEGGKRVRSQLAVEGDGAYEDEDGEWLLAWPSGWQ